MTFRIRHHFPKIAVAVLVTFVFPSCFDRTSFFNYHAVDLDGWDRTDFQEYHVDPVASDGYYVEEIGVRTTNAYPYQRLHLVVKQDIISTIGKRSGRFRCDTLHIDIYDGWGKPKGKGTSLYQHVVPFKTLPLKAGDSLSVRIAHDMQVFSLTGVSDVGLKVTRQ